MSLLTGAISRLWQFGVVSPFTDPLDFRAFYCAGAAVAQRADPYRLEPDRSCQRSVLAGAGLKLNEDFVLPAPLPPYALVAFAGLAWLPFRLAAELWMALNIIAIFVSIVLLTKLSGSRPAFVACALFLSAGIVCLSLGQMVPLVLAAVLFAALCARRNDGIGAALGATIASVEPHLALPVWLGLGLFVSDARRPLVVAATALTALTLLPGVQVNLEYLRSVIPAHARAELPNFEIQYGLSSLLAAINVPAEIALSAGSACYAVMLVFGLALGAALKRRFQDPAYCIVAPLGAIVLGGPFLHIQQTVVAIPLGFMLVARLPRRSRALRCAVVALFLLAVPWPLMDIARAQPAIAVRAARTPVTTRVSDATPNGSIEIPYAAFVDRFERRANKHSVGELIARKLPTWFAIMTLLAIASYVARGARRSRVGEGLASHAA